MKPENAITASVWADLSQFSFEEALIALKCFPICTLRVSAVDVEAAQRITRSMLPTEKESGICPRVHIVLDEDYKPLEWSVEYNGKVFWSSGA